MSDFRGRMQEYLDVLKYQKNYSEMCIRDRYYGCKN